MAQKYERRTAYALTEISRGNTIYERIGFSRINKDGSETVFLRALPVSGKLQLRAADKDDGDVAPEPEQEG